MVLPAKRTAHSPHADPRWSSPRASPAKAPRHSRAAPQGRQAAPWERHGPKAAQESIIERTQPLQGSLHHSPFKLIRSRLRAAPSWLFWPQPGLLRARAFATEPHPASPPSQPETFHAQSWVSCTCWKRKAQLWFLTARAFLDPPRQRKQPAQSTGTTRSSSLAPPSPCSSRADGQAGLPRGSGRVEELRSRQSKHQLGKPWLQKSICEISTPQAHGRAGEALLGVSRVPCCHRQPCHGAPFVTGSNCAP